jgi:hypothetical protein
VLSRALVSHRYGRVVLAALCMATGVLAFSGSAAQAALVHPFVSSFGSFAAVGAVAVDQSSGDVYVLDAGAGTVTKYGATGNPVNFSTTGTDVIQGVEAGSANEIAVDNSTGPARGDIYVANISTVRIYSSGGVLLGELTGSFPCGVAVDHTGNLYVGFYPETVKKYTPTSNLVSASDEVASMGGLNSICNVAVDGEGNLYAASFAGGVSKYEALQFGSPAAIGTEIDGEGSTLAVDQATNDVYIDEGSQVAQYNSSGTKLGSSGSGSLSGSQGVAIKSGGDLYASDGGGHVDIFGPAVVEPDVTTQSATSVTQATVTLHGSVNPDEILVSACQFEYRAEAEVSYVHTASCSPVPGSGNAPEEVTAQLGGLVRNTTYYYRLAATNANGTNRGAAELFTTPGPPAVISQSAEPIAKTSATLNAQINPDGFDTHYHFEYGTGSGYGTSVPVPDADLGSGFAEVGANVEITGLKAGATYHFRVVASNEAGPVSSPDQTFTTVPAAQIESESATNVTATGSTLQAQINPLGNDTTYYVEYGTTNCAESPSACVQTPTPPGAALGAGESPVGVSTSLLSLQVGTTYHYRFVAVNTLGTVDGPDQVFTTPSGAKTVSETCPNEQLRREDNSVGLPECRAYELVSPPQKGDADILAPTFPGEPVISAQASPSGNAVAYQSVGAFAGAKASLGQNIYLSSLSDAGWSTESLDPPSLNTAKTDLKATLVVDQSGDKAVTGSLEALAPGAVQGNMNIYLRDNKTGASTLIATSSAYDFRSRVEAEGESLIAATTSDFSHIILVTTVALTPNAVPGVQNLYDWTGGTMHLVSQMQNGEGFPSESTMAGTRTRPISIDGSRVFFDSGGALYMREDNQRTIPISVSHRAGDSSEPKQGALAGASADGSLVYFLSEANLTEGADVAGEGYAALYRYDVDTGQLVDITPAGEVMRSRKVLSVSEDGAYVYFEVGGIPFFGEPDHIYVWHEGVAKRIEEKSLEEEPFLYSSSPNGQYVAFTLGTQLTGYNNQSSACGGKCAEVYIYDDATGSLSCASCNPSGEAPRGPAEMGGAFTSMRTGGPFARTVLDNGSVFFETKDPLVPADSNGTVDVYRYLNGQIDLISSGESEFASSFADASASGNDIFLYTSQRLVGQDVDSSTDVYDARVGGGRPAPAAPAQCSGTGCQGVPSVPPNYATPPSATFNGVGNFPGASAKTTAKTKPETRAQKLSKALMVCRVKKNKGQRATCEAAARRKYGAVRNDAQKRKKTTKTTGRGK